MHGCGPTRPAFRLGDDASHLTLAMHMLYHVPEPVAAVRELRRITRPAGQVLVVLNGADHLCELRDLIAAALRDIADDEPPLWERRTLDDSVELLASEFAQITRHEFTGELLIPHPQPVEDYGRSMITTQNLQDPGAFAAAVSRGIPTDDQGIFRVRTHCGCLVCS